jgi:DNA-binding NarL/FixJ family response regulator
VRQTLSALGDEHDIVEATNYQDTLKLARTGFADLILLDLGMPDLPGGSWRAGVAQVCAAFPTAKVIVLSGMEDGATVAGALRSGAHGFLPKTTPAKTVLAAIAFVMKGEIYVPPALLGAVPAETSDLRLDEPDIQQTDKEHFLLRSLVNGMTNKEIARELGVEEVTVKKWLQRTYRRLGAGNRVDAVRIVLNRGILSKEEE